LVSRVASACGISGRSLYRVREYDEQTHNLKFQRKPKCRKTIAQNFDDFDKNAIRRKAHEFFFRN
jgi:hypothetical protein